MFAIPVIFCILIFYLLKDRLRLTSAKGIFRQLIIGATLIALFIINIIFNFGYYSQYAGPENEAYEVAITLVHLLEIGLVVSFVFLICSVISGYDKNSFSAGLSEFRKMRNDKKRKVL